MTYTQSPLRVTQGHSGSLKVNSVHLQSPSSETHVPDPLLSKGDSPSRAPPYHPSQCL